ncbi:c-type cytochrome [Mesorhizobium sp. LHD-90]|uniref:c-type cytochrome n=1 Tax=Mesorhizobium sp. LHD-90 TaxID=3071414 RepID=UPI0027DEE185|nr:c-type cytochrome [Mesorhizobium sp. LHD-90]MDQ6437729.1 c-type cytochrome [Mesorhizobium sp. LHD-90]
MTAGRGAGAALFLATVGAGAAAAVLGVYAFLDKGSAALLAPDDANVVARGKAVYVEHCASCHGRNLEGQPDWQTRGNDGFLPAPPHDETGHTWHHPDRLLFDITKRGVAAAAELKGYETRMPAFGGVLSDDDIVAVLTYIKSRWPEEIRRRHDSLNRARSKGTP